MDIAPLTFPIKDLQLRESYARLIPSSLHTCLDGLDPFELKSSIIGVGVTLDSHPMGIALASVYNKVHTAHIHVLMLKNETFSLNNAEKLLHVLTQLLIEENVTLVTFHYSKEDPFSNIVEKVFLKNHWQGPRPFIIECLFKSADFAPSWRDKKMEFAKGFEEFLFKNLTHQEYQDLVHRYEQMSIPKYVYPFGREEKLIEYKNSLGLRYQGKVIGWMITHRIAPDTIRYSALYLEDDFVSTGYWLKLLIDAIHIQQDKQLATYGLLEINLDQISKPWLKFIQRKLFPQACQIIHRDTFWKKLKEH